MTGAAAEDRLTGPVAAELVRVVDGDTLAVKAHIWLGQTIETKVRIRGIDTPETKGKCAREVSMAAAATASFGRLSQAKTLTCKGRANYLKLKEICKTDRTSHAGLRFDLMWRFNYVKLKIQAWLRHDPRFRDQGRRASR